MSDTITPEERVELRELAAKATPGPWLAKERDMANSARQCCTTVMSLAARKRMQKETGRTDVFCSQDYFRCPNKAKVCRDGKWYCGVHDPLAVRERHKKQEERKRERQHARAGSGAKFGKARQDVQGMSDFYRKEIDRLRAVLKSVTEIVSDAPALNMSNYDADQVSALNDAMINACAILQRRALAGEG